MVIPRELSGGSSAAWLGAPACNRQRCMLLGTPYLPNVRFQPLRLLHDFYVAIRQLKAPPGNVQDRGCEFTTFKETQAALPLFGCRPQDCKSQKAKYGPAAQVDAACSLRLQIEGAARPAQWMSDSGDASWDAVLCSLLPSIRSAFWPACIMRWKILSSSSFPKCHCNSMARWEPGAVCSISGSMRYTQLKP